MDNEGNGFNKLVVLLAVGIVGAMAGQHFFKLAPQQQGPWAGYSPQPPQVVYAPPGYPPPGYGYAGYGQQTDRPAPPLAAHPYGTLPLQTPAADPVVRVEQRGSTPLRRQPSASMTRLVSSDESEFGDDVPAVPIPAPDRLPAVDIAFGQPSLDAAVNLTPAVITGTAFSSTVPSAEIAFIEDSGVLWSDEDVSIASTTVMAYLRVRNGDSELLVEHDPKSVNATINTKPLKLGPRRANDLYGPFEVTVASAANPASFAVRLVKPVAGTNDGPFGASSRFKKLQLPISQDIAPKSIQVLTNRLGGAVAAPAVAINIYEQYLRLTGTAVGATSVELVVCTSSPILPGKFVPLATIPPRDAPRPANNSWGITPDLSALTTGSSGRILVRSLDGSSQHAYADKPIDFTIQPRPVIEGNELAITKIEQKQPDGSFVERTGRFNQQTLKITGAAPTHDKVPDGQAVFIVNGKEMEIDKIKKALDASPTFVFEWTAPPDDGKHSIAIAVVQGNRIIRTSDVRAIEIRRTGPRAMGISPDNLALTPGINVVDVQFNADDLNEATLDAGQFVFVPAIAVTSASIIAGNKVRLVLGNVPPNAYKLTVSRTQVNSKILADVFGNPLGTSPVASEDKTSFEFGLIKPVGSELSSTPTAGLKNLTGPNVMYPEFTPPRLSTTGFNPSDKVVTRVARLYYYRDAHRVVQLINRGARSYNRQAVDMQQQLADNARRDAENATGERQAAERTAIQAAQRARAAETALTQFQQALVTARQQQQAAEGDLQRQQTIHRTSEDDLEDATATRQGLEQIDQTMMTAAEKADLASQIKAARRTETTLARKVEASDQTMTRLQANVTAARGEVTEAERRVNGLLGEVQTARDEEASQRELMDKRQFEEDLKHKDLFRREVAAAHEDPDTYAPGKPDSQDPIEQVSLSVIGEGLIQLRGPLKGVNLARTLINQIDAPVGQVKVAIHTVQVNGEHGKRMEPVVGRIQRYIDHSRFLTTQSSQMLRNAVTLVASRRADEAMAGCEGLGQHERNQKYIEAFFGKEFLAELRTLDSEFLHTGNKLLSLHSMDSTSLANALFLLSLAKNDVRQEILREFEQMVTCQLPQDETDYFAASNEKYTFGPPFHKQKFQFLGHNAKFVSLKGFFNAEVAGAETLTPMQREFIRLAQIFKSRLVTEIELQQRVLERSLIEDRMSDYMQMQEDALKDESIANAAVKAAENAVEQMYGDVERILTVFRSEMKATINQVKQLSLTLKAADKSYRNNSKAAAVSTINFLATDPVAPEDISKGEDVQPWTLYDLGDFSDVRYKIEEVDQQLAFKVLKDRETGKVPDDLHRMVVQAFWTQKDRLDLLKRYSYPSHIEEKLKSAEKQLDELSPEIQSLSPNGLVPDVTAPIYRPTLITLNDVARVLDEAQVEFERFSAQLEFEIERLLIFVRDRENELAKALNLWIVLREQIRVAIKDPNLRAHVDVQISEVNSAFFSLLKGDADVAAAKRLADRSRRPLDHKKFMDMLIDDVEDKFIELMEGTRAHTANIDNYLSRLGQALEDDFNTQFYFPAFKGIREASRYWDVNMGQIETTTILTNNRAFAKVSPQATMEFDLPKRDILIQEAFEAAEAAYSDYGALLGDPTFLSLVKMHRGQPPSAQFGSGDSVPTTRNMLPGLPSSTDENLMAQNRAVAPDFPSALESLIPDPAIYKFETGTGFEIRPVIQPDGQAVVFHFNYMYTTNVREPVRADEKHLGRVKRHFIDTDVQIGNYEMREVSKYQVALKASRTSRGVPLLEDIPAAGILFRPLPSQESSLQENIILAQSVIFPTLFDLMGLRWAPAVADLDSLRLIEADFVVRSRQRALQERVFDYSSQQVDEFMRIPPAERRPDLYRSQESTPYVHPNGYSGPGLKLQDGVLREGYSSEDVRPESRYVPGTSPEGAVPRGVPNDEGPLIEGPPPTMFEPLPAPDFDHSDGHIPYSTLPPSPVRGLQSATKYRNSRTVTADGAAPADSGLKFRLQSYQTEARPPATFTSRLGAPPRESRPLPKSTRPAPAPLPTPMPGRRPTISGDQKPSAARDGDPSWYGWSSAVEPDHPVRPVSETKSNGESRRSNIVNASASEPANSVKVQTPAPAKKKFGVTSILSKKP